MALIDLLAIFDVTIFLIIGYLKKNFKCATSHKQDSVGLAETKGTRMVIIPRNYTNDIHICGRCRVQFTLLSLFLKHKESCRENELKEFDQNRLNTKEFHQNQLSVKEFDHNQMNTKEFDQNQLNAKELDQNRLVIKSEVDSLIEVNSLESFNEGIEKKDSNQINSLNNLLLKDDTQLRQPKIDIFEDQELCIGQKESSLNENNLAQQKNQLDCKRTLQNDEEVIATLLANQLNSETSAGNDNLNSEVSAHSFENFSKDPLIKEKKVKEEKDDNKVMYRGKMRKLFICQMEGCVYKTLLRKDIERHSRVHTGERPFKCFLCGKTFNRTDKLLLHQRIHAGDKRYKCTKCDYAAVDSGSLIKHLRVHNGERPFKCQLCSYRARDSSQLTVHLRTHTGDSPFICTNSKCKAAFKTNSDLKRHMVVHSEEKPHSCIYCPYKSTLKRNLQIHIQSQHPNGELKEYKCDLCPTFVLPTSRKLKNHIRKHHGIVDGKTLSESKIFAEDNPSSEEGNSVEKQETHKKRKRKARRSNDKIAVGVMSKAYDCKLCEASFVCQDSLVTHQRYHVKVEEEMRKSEYNRDSIDIVEDIKCKEEIDKKVESFGGDLGLSDGCEVDSSFNDSLKNAEILASLNSSQGIGNIRQYVMIAPEAVQNVYNSDEYVLVQN